MSTAYALALALRRVRRQPAVACWVMAVLALGLGATTVVLAIYHATVIRALPFPEPEHLFLLRQAKPNQATDAVNYLNYMDWRQQSRSFQELAGYSRTLLTVAGEPEPTLLAAARVSDNFFVALGVGFTLGREFSSDEVEKGERVLVLSHGLWQRRYGGDSSLLGKTLSINGVPYVVVGVAGERLAFPPGVEAWVPLALTEGERSQRETRNLWVIGRLLPKISATHARQEMALLGDRLAREHPSAYAGSTVTLTPLVEELVGGLRRRLRLLVALAALVLLLACSLAINLQLARAVGREGEARTRMALGASPAHLVKGALAEGLVIAVGSACGGLGLAGLALELLRRWQPDSLPGLAGAGLDWRVVLGVTVLALVSACGCELAPWLARWLRWGPWARQRQPARGSLLVQNSLVVVSLALAVVLLSSAGLVTKSLLKLHAIEPGISSAGLVAFQLALPQASYPQVADRLTFYQAAVYQLEELPGVRGAAATSDGGIAANILFRAREEGQNTGPADGHLVQNAVTPSYFQTLGMPLLTGRRLTEQDGPGSSRVGVVNESLARRVWPGESPLGRRVKTWDPAYGDRPQAEAITEWEVVGVVADSRVWALDRSPEPTLYVPFSRSPRRAMTLLVRTENEPLARLAELKAALWRLDSGLPISEIRTVEESWKKSVRPLGFQATAIGLFAVVGLILAAVGLYALMSYLVRRSRRELGIRVALGASPNGLRRLVLARSGRLLSLGLLLGASITLPISRLWTPLLFEVSSDDISALVGSLLLLLAVGLVASLVPARQAGAVEPAEALRLEPLQ